MNVQEIDEENKQTGATPEKDEKVFLYITNQDNGKDKAIVTLIINNQLPVTFKLDTGAQANIIPKSVFDQLSPKPKLQSTNQRLTSYCGAKIPVHGTCDLNCSHKTSFAVMHKFYIVDAPSPLIIGYQSSISLDLIKLILSMGQSWQAMFISLSRACTTSIITIWSIEKNSGNSIQLHQQQKASSLLSLTVEPTTDLHNYTVQNLVKQEQTSTDPKQEDKLEHESSKPGRLNRPNEPFQPFEAQEKSDYSDMNLSGSSNKSAEGLQLKSEQAPSQKKNI
ncbi:hypothetical protein QYM36_015153 [Artemia franciscana]|uniref:Peptidase A2 domain-containing protein n=1 Tax=Artemia franciscana TaxID=6661 RepID=A0AA88H8K4_ARTSF|nr:hypothetical protein QYM36_015153 [Artemia franciscana]